MENNQWLSFFPNGKTPRNEQIQCITEGISFFEQDIFRQQILLINAPTGIGKTLIAYCLARYFHNKYGFGSNYLVHNKTLEKQILDDNLAGLNHTYGRNNFTCKQNGQSCDVGECLKTSDEKFKCEYKPMKIELTDKLTMAMDNDQEGMNTVVSEADTNVTMDRKEAKKVAEIIKSIGKESVYKYKKLFTPEDITLYYKHYDGVYIPKSASCTYWESKLKAMQSPIALHNYWYYVNEVNYIGDFRARYLLICDEGHKLEDIVLSFVSFSISKKQCEDLGFKMEFKKHTLGNWLPLIEEFKNYLCSSRFDSFLFQSYDTQSRKYQNQERTLLGKKEKTIKLRDKFLEEIERFKGFDKRNWVVEHREDKDDGEILKVDFKPIEPKGYVYNTLLKYGMKIIIMSATLLSKERMIDVLGVEDFDDDTHIKYIDLNSPFPIENRIVHYRPISSMSYKILEQSTDKIIGEIRTILSKHVNQKGIIHTKSYQLMNMIASRLKDPRILIHDNDTRQDTINMYIRSEKPLVLVSPSIEEGMDFRDDLCRFIIIAKVPYLNLGDPQIKAHANKDPAWYSWKAIQSIIQEAGRGVRHETDWCSTYIIDSNFGRLLESYRRFFPQWFLDAIVNESKSEKQFDDE